jgi:oligopeptide/dipeptide ABC transporter ATP-binding protein
VFPGEKVTSIQHPASSIGTETLVEVQKIRTWFPIRRGVFATVAGHVKAVQDVSLAVRRGETVALVGESGCGKTTLGRTMVGLEKPMSGKVFYLGRDMANASAEELRQMRRDVQFVFQDPQSSLNPRMTVLDLVTEALVEHGLLDGTKEEAAARLLAQVGMDEGAFHRYPFEFSGGQRQRICIARALGLRPSLLICDEPVSSLDVSVQAQVINLMMDLKARLGLAYLFITHDLGVVRLIADRVAVMYLGHIVEEGPVERVMEDPKHPYTQALLSAIPALGMEKRERIVLQGDVPSPANPPQGCPFHTRCPKVMDVCRSKYPDPRTVAGAEVRCHLY